MWINRDLQGRLLHKGPFEIKDPRAQEVPDEDVENEAIVSGILWKTRDANGAVVDVCPHYPFHPDAEPVDVADPDVVAMRAEAATTKAMRATERNPGAELSRLKTLLVQKGILAQADIDALTAAK